MKAARSAGMNPVILTAGAIRYGIMKRTIAFANHLMINERFLKNGTSFQRNVS
jgi:hypothetical protein